MLYLKAITDIVVSWPQQATIPVMVAIHNGSEFSQYHINNHELGPTTNQILWTDLLVHMLIHKNRMDSVKIGAQFATAFSESILSTSAQYVPTVNNYRVWFYFICNWDFSYENGYLWLKVSYPQLELGNGYEVLSHFIFNICSKWSAVAEGRTFF